MQDIEHSVSRLIGRMVFATADVQAEQGGAFLQQGSVGQNNRMRGAGLPGQGQTQLRADTGGFAAGDGYAGRHHFSSRRFST
jgi:hypothetical protein